MDGRVDLTTIVLLSCATALYLLFNYFLGFKYDSREPPLVPQKVPYVGNILGIIRYGTKYYTRKSAQYPLPIYTLAMLNGRTYVVNAPDLIAAVQRSPKVFSFDPFILHVGKRLSNATTGAMDVIADNMDSKRGDWGLNSETRETMHAALAPGSTGLDLMNIEMLQNVSVALDELDCRDGMVVNLYKWARHLISMASTDAVYGPKNPLRTTAGIEEAFWDFEENATMLIVNIAPNITAPKGHRGRENVADAFAEYFRQAGQETAAALTKGRYAKNTKYNISIEDMAHFELANMIGILVNTAPATFWTITNMLADPILLADARRELDAVLSIAQDKDGSGPMRIIDVTKLKTDCPLLLSTFQEVLRTRSHNASVRWVMEDTMLCDRYLMKKDAIIQMPSMVVHSEPNNWGPNAKEFDARRFIKSQQKSDKQFKQHPAAFRAFGGGSTLCPGRHFATTEILSVVAMFILRYDVVPIGDYGKGEGQWVLPKQDSNNLATSVLPPDTDVKVNITKRKGYEDGKWSFTLSKSTAKFALSSG